MKFTLSLIFGVLIVESIVLIILLMKSRSGNMLTKRFLAFSTLLAAIVIGKFFFYVSGLYQSLPNLIFTTYWTAWLLPTAYYFHISTLFKKKKSFNIKDLLHTIPALVVLVVMSLIHSPIPPYQKQKAIESFMKFYLLPVPKILGILLFSLGILGCFYTYYSRKLFIGLDINGFSKKQRHRVNAYNKINLSILIAWGALSVFYAYTMFTGRYFFIGDMILSTLTIGLIILNALYAVLQVGFMKFKVFNNSKERLVKEEATSLRNTINNLLMEEKVYLNSEYRLEDLCKSLDQPKTFVSQVVNDLYGKKFLDILSEFRLQHFQDLLNDPSYKDYKILAIAYESGFNSKSSFYRIFKKHYGVTPSQYKENILIEH